MRVKEKNKSGFLGSCQTAIPVACVVIGSMVGHNSATGQIMVQYVGQYGTWILFLPIVAMLILGLSITVVAELVRRNQAYDYSRLFGVQMGPVGKQKWFLVLNDIVMVFGMLVGFASIWATSAMVVADFGVSPVLGYAIVILATLVLAKWGSEFLKKMNTILVFLIIAVMVIFCVIATANPSGSMSISESISTWYNPVPNTPLYVILWGAVLWGAYQTGQGAHAAPTMRRIKTLRDSVFCGLFTWILSSVFYCINAFAIVSAAPEIYGQTAPNLLILATLKVKYPWLYWVFDIMILMAILSTTVTLTNSMSARFTRIMPSQWNPTVKYGVVVTALYGGSLILSSIGLAKIIGLTTYSGYWNMAFVMIPLLVVWPIILIVRGVKQRKDKVTAPDAREE